MSGVAGLSSDLYGLLDNTASDAVELILGLAAGAGFSGDSETVEVIFLDGALEVRSLLAASSELDLTLDEFTDGVDLVDLTASLPTPATAPRVFSTKMFPTVTSANQKPQ